MTCDLDEDVGDVAWAAGWEEDCVGGVSLFCVESAGCDADPPLAVDGDGIEPSCADDAKGPALVSCACCCWNC